MRITDHRYDGEIDRFELAMRMIGHEARTGTIRACTGFTEDRIRKIYGSYFKSEQHNTVKRRRGKSPMQINSFLNSSRRQFESSVLASFFVICDVVQLDANDMPIKTIGIDRVNLGQRICDAYESYTQVHPKPQFSFELAWGLFMALTHAKELEFSQCHSCNSRYIHDRYALNYHFCPSCELLN
ncbi:MAG: FlhC family transcriptional regulator [Gammaproteobacteria bacterium]|nr:FlhC family transcriptional regulator [Gammaproteobacteria bacterium]